MSRFGLLTVLCVSGLLVLSACGSGQAASPGAGSAGSAASAAASPAASTPAGASPLAVHIGRYTQEFATPLPANPAQAKVIEGFRETQILWDRSLSAWHPVAPVTGYVTGNALVTLQQAMQYNRKYDLKIAGMDRFYSIRVSGITGRRATVTSCDDARKLMEVDARTGRVVPQTVPPDKAYLFEIWHMVELSGHWGLASVRPYPEPSPQAELCRSLPDARA
jgi:hypothetical protein